MSKKYSKFILAAVLCAAMATPALADSKISGYFRTQFIADNIASPNMSSDAKRTNTQIDNRFRLMYQNNLNEYVNFVYFGEVDTMWGQAGSGTKYPGGQGGADGADGVNVETKNVFVDFKVPDSIVSTRIGIQGVGVGPHGILLGDDMAAARVNLKLSPMADVTGIYSKWRENSTAVWDDVDFYAAVVGVKPSDKLKFNIDLGYLDANSLSTTASNNPGVSNGLDKALADSGYHSATVYAVGFGGEANLGVAVLDGYLAYTGGTVEDEVTPKQTDIDLGGMMGTIKATTKIGTLGDAGLRATYYTADKDDDDNDYKGFIGDLSGGVNEFSGENLSIFFADPFYNNTNGGRRALLDAAYAGNGLLAINGTANLNFSKTCYGKFGAGWFSALEENGAEDKNLGVEVAARVGTKVAEKVDLSLGGAYAFLGDFYKSGSADPDNVYKVNFMVNVPY